GLAKAVYPATLITLILSDVVGDDLDSIASGPCVPDLSSFKDCLAILTKYSIEEQIPPPVFKYIYAGAKEEESETLKSDHHFFQKTLNVIVASNFNALLKAKEKGDELGYNTLLLSSMLEGETREVAGNHVAIAREIQQHGLPLETPACLLSGGETTVKIRGTGLGGRNQEFVLAAAIKMRGMENVVVLSGGRMSLFSVVELMAMMAQLMLRGRLLTHQRSSARQRLVWIRFRTSMTTTPTIFLIN
ncbi:MAG: DUF4147 domain-containing protein, partial [Deltaproteobacteria bacterium]|nr:DUF4147 domain-containing protein [Deltaproteobacteria bacterium]